ncbi:MAG: hypothetical protein AAF674_09770 [Pseudomonadota bacterium]
MTTVRIQCPACHHAIDMTPDEFTDRFGESAYAGKWRMKDNGILWTVPGRKGVYSTSEPVDEVERPEPQRPDPRDEFGPVHMDEEDASIPF